jgi:6-phosphogluconolactonase
LRVASNFSLILLQTLKPVKVKFYAIALSILFIAACNPDKKKEQDQKGKDYSCFVGTYTSGDSDGIYKIRMNKDGNFSSPVLAARSENPSFLALTDDSKFLVAVNENDKGSVESFQVKGDKLESIGKSESGGAHPCYVTIAGKSYVLAANYTGGNIGILKIDETGKLSDLLDIQQHEGAGTTERQTGPHAHSVISDPMNGNIIAADLGTNELWFSKIDTIREKLIPRFPHKLKLRDGAGPRHMAFHPDGNHLYVINELNSTISLLARGEEGKFQLKSSISTIPPDFDGENYCADIHVSPDGKYLYASNRGHNSIAIFKIVPVSDKLVPHGHEHVRGDWPRNFAISPDGNFLLVANQRSGNIVSFKRNQETGIIEFIGEISLPEPVCIVFNQ